jgi:hypothetical protein
MRINKGIGGFLDVVLGKINFFRVVLFTVYYIMVLQYIICCPVGTGLGIGGCTLKNLYCFIFSFSHKEKTLAMLVPYVMSSTNAKRDIKDIVYRQSQ